MRRLAAIAIVAASLGGASVGAASDVAPSVTNVRAAISAVEAYRVRHHGYQGMTLAKLRAIEPSIRGVRVRSATQRTYCVESTTRPYVHKAGPRADLRTGHCGERGTPVVIP
jgi:hypothetical protein